MSSTFPIAILNVLAFVARRNSHCFGQTFAYQKLMKLNWQVEIRVAHTFLSLYTLGQVMRDRGEQGRRDRVKHSGYSVARRDKAGQADTAGQSSLGGGWMIFHFRVFESILFFVNWNSLYFFHLLYSTNMLCLLFSLYLIRFLKRSYPVSSQDFYCSLTRD